MHASTRVYVTTCVLHRQGRSRLPRHGSKGQCMDRDLQADKSVTTVLALNIDSSDGAVVPFTCDGGCL